jgi:hypothetical protein
MLGPLKGRLPSNQQKLISISGGNLTLLVTLFDGFRRYGQDRIILLVKLASGPIYQVTVIKANDTGFQFGQGSGLFEAGAFQPGLGQVPAAAMINRQAQALVDLNGLVPQG